MTRTTARECVLQILFSTIYNHTDIQEALDNYFASDFAALNDKKETCAPDDPQMPYIREVCEGVSASASELDDTIRKYLKGWTLERITPIAKTILQISLYEMQHIEDIPVASSINAAVDLAKKYDTPNTAVFINGVLGSFYREEMQDGKE